MRTTPITLNCDDPTCDGWTGFDGVDVPNFEYEPGWIEPDSCPHCGGAVSVDVRGRSALNVDVLVEDILRTLEDAGVRTPTERGTDARALVKVLLAEVARQVNAEKRARTWTPAVIAAVNAAVDAEFPPTEQPDWLAGGTR